MYELSGYPNHLVVIVWLKASLKSYINYYIYFQEMQTLMALSMKTAMKLCCNIPVQRVIVVSCLYEQRQNCTTGCCM